MEFTLRSLSNHDEYLQCVELQRETWGDFELVPTSVLMVARKMGGVAVGAFDTQGKLLGFVFGLSGLRKGELAHWSHMLAVRKGIRNTGLGRCLKLHQRQLVLELGVQMVYWTYDPLVARNAHLNLNRLGAVVDEYLEDVYPGSTSPLHAGLGTDRFIVAWDLKSDRVARLLNGERESPQRLEDWGPAVNSRLSEDGTPMPLEEDPPSIPRLRVEVPQDIQAVKAEVPELGSAWRASTRHAFKNCLSRGYRVRGMQRCGLSGRCYYLLSRETPSADELRPTPREAASG